MRVVKQRNRVSSGRSASVLLLLSALALTSCATEPEPEPVVELTLTEAGEAYRATICPVNDAWDELDGLVDDMRSALVIQPADLQLREKLLRESLMNLAEQSAAAAASFESQQESFPQSSRPAFEQMIETLTADAEQATELAKQSAAEIADHEWQGVPESVAAATAVREELGMQAEHLLTCDDS